MMKTSFTKLFREKWKAIVPFLFFCTMSFLAKADFDPCGSLTDISQVTVEVTCVGEIIMTVDKNSTATYEFGTIINGIRSDLGESSEFGNSVTFDHGSLNLEGISGQTFFVQETCSGNAIFYGVLPDYDNDPADVPGTYTFTTDVNSDAKSPSTAREHDPVASPDALRQPVVTAQTIKPSCPDQADGTIILTLSGDGADKCSAQFTWNLASSSSFGGPLTGTFTNGVATIPRVPSGPFNFAFQSVGPATATGCLCTPIAPAPISVTVEEPGQSSASLSCIDRINVSAESDEHGCEATIRLDDIALGVTDICDSGNNTADFIIVRNSQGAVIPGTYLGMDLVPLAPQTGSGFAFRFDATQFFGEEVTVEVHDGTGNLCWGTALIEDKAPPVISCDEDGVSSILCIDFDNDAELAIEGTIFDCSETDVTVIEFRELADCDPNTSVLRRVQLIYFAEDEFGNRSQTCNDTFDIIRLGRPSVNNNLDFIDGVELIGPGNFEKTGTPFACDSFSDLDGDGVPDPTMAGAGFPRLEVTREDGSIDTIPLAALNYDDYGSTISSRRNQIISDCKLGATFQDTRLGSFDCVTKILRRWTVGEWTCQGEIDTTFTQVIDIVDTIAPYFVQSTLIDITGSVGAHGCVANMPVPLPSASDNCSSQSDIEIDFIILNAAGQIVGPDRRDEPGTSFDFPLGSSFIVYTAFDGCGNSRRDTVNVSISDLAAPVTICKDRLVVGISGVKSTDNGLVKVPATAFDNGSFDDCGLESICVARMDDLSAFDNLDTDGDGFVAVSALSGVFACDRTDEYAQFATIIPGSSPAINGISRAVLCRGDVSFCCSDDGEDVLVVFQATDAAGNVNQCYVEVDIQDKSTPSIQCPPDVVVDCEVPLPFIPEDALDVFINVTENPDRNFLGALFGNIVSDHSQQPFGIDPIFVNGSDMSTLLDGVFLDNCEQPDIYVRINSSFDQCQTGQIVRTFFAEDASGNRSPMCEQVITIESRIPFDAANIVKPRDTTLTSCMLPEEIANTTFGVPIAPQGACMLFGTSFEDQIFRFNNNSDIDAPACFKIIRTWSIIDICNDDHSPGDIVTCEQIILINDPVDPVITCPADVVIETFECDADQVELTASAFDDCTIADELFWTATIDVDNDGTIDLNESSLDGSIQHSTSASGSSVATIVRSFPLGTHRITWTVFDGCGNSEQCSYLFTIVNTKSPTPFAVDVTTVLHESGSVTIWAEDLNNKSEHPCFSSDEIDVALVRSGGDFADVSPNITFTCTDFVNGPDIDLDFYAFIDLGNGQVLRDFTTVTVTLQDNSGVCDNFTGGGSNTGQSAVIAGSIRTEGSQAVPDIEIDLLGGNQAASTVNATATDVLGRYTFPAMPVGNDFTIDPVSNDDYLNGVTTLDVVMIQRYILGLVELESAYKIMAADINNDRNVSAVDLIDLRNVILGVTEEFTNNDSWRFIDADQQFIDPNNPLAEPIKEQYNITPLDQDMVIDFIGFKVGDVNASADAATTLAQSRSVFAIEMADQSYSAGDIISVPVMVSRDINTVGLQFTTEFDPTGLIFAGIDGAGLDILPEHIGYNRVDEGIITVSWNDVDANPVAANQSLMTLNFKAVQSGQLSDFLAINSSVTQSEIYNDHLETMDLVAKYVESDDVAESGFELYQNSPNPFADQTVISFKLPKASNATLSIFDVTGKLVKVTRGSFDKGINTIQLSKNDLAVSGVLYYTLETEGFTATERMVVLK
jgi:hypothetical protein